MDFQFIDDIILDIYKAHNIFSFPLSCLELLETFELSVYPYSKLDVKLREYCLKMSNDAYCYKDKIFYNDEVNKYRINFSLMHELGHIVLNHGVIHTSQKEQEANYFASHFLAPRIAIHYSECKNYTHVAHKFELSYEAAQYAFDDYRRWHRQATYKMSIIDKSMYSHFFNKEYGGFVHSITNCHFCGDELYNTPEPHCDRCTKMFKLPTFRTNTNKHEDIFYISESNWLYGGL